MFNLSAIYEKQNDNFKNVEFLTKACNLDHAKACHNLAYKYYNEERVELAPVKAITLYEKACDLGYSNACFNLGVAYLDGKFFAVNKRQTKVILTKVCLLNNQSACEEYNKLDK